MASNLIPTISLSKLKKLSAQNIMVMKSVEVTADGEHIATLIIPPKNGGMSITDAIKTQAEYLASRGNTTGGKTPEELLTDGA